MLPTNWLVVWLIPDLMESASMMLPKGLTAAQQLMSVMTVTLELQKSRFPMVTMPGTPPGQPGSVSMWNL